MIICALWSTLYATQFEACCSLLPKSAVSSSASRPAFISLASFQEHAEKEPSLVALFTFVARHPVTQKALELNKLLPATPEEKLLFEQRQMVADARRAARKASSSEQQQGQLLL